MKLEILGFQGMRPGIGDGFLESTQAVLARDCRVSNGELRSLRQPVQRGTLVKSGSIQTIYLYRGQHWFHWAVDVDVVGNPIPGDTFDRVFWTGDGQPKVTTAQLATSGTAMPAVSRHLGVPGPTQPPTVAGAEGVENETRAYVYTYVNEWGWESAPSPASSLITVAVDSPVAVSGLAGPPTGPYSWAFIRIYRLSTGVDSSDFFFVDRLPATAETYDDEVPSSDLDEVLETEGWVPPPDTMRGLTALPNGAMAGFVGHDIYFSPPGIPYAYPRAWTLATEYDVVGLASFENNLVILTEGHPYLATGSDPSAMMLSKLEIAQACVSKRSIVSVGAMGVLYASPDGLVAIGSQIAMVSDSFMSRDEWQKYNPSSIIGVAHDNVYIGFFTRTNGARGAFVFSAKDGFIELSLTATAAYSDLQTDTLYFTDGGSKQVMEYDAGAPMQYLWKSKEFDVPPVSFSSFRIRGVAPFGSLQLRLLADGQQVFSQSVTSSDGRRLPVVSGGARRWQLELSGTSTIEGVTLATSMEELRP